MIPQHALSALANHLWQSTLFAAVAWLVALSVGKNHAQARHSIWLAASAKFLIPFCLLAGIGSHIGSRTAPAAPPELSVVMEQVSQPFAPSARGSSASKAGPVTVDPSAGVPLVAVWFCGFAAVFLFWRVRWRRVTAVVRAAMPLREGRELEGLRRCQRIAGLRGYIELLPSAESLEPGVFGIFLPVLLLPAGMSGRLAGMAPYASLLSRVPIFSRPCKISSGSSWK
jgi:bla regulator protein BlaR1